MLYREIAGTQDHAPTANRADGTSQLWNHSDTPSGHQRAEERYGVPPSSRACLSHQKPQSVCIGSRLSPRTRLEKWRNAGHVMATAMTLYEASTSSAATDVRTVGRGSRNVTRGAPSERSTSSEMRLRGCYPELDSGDRVPHGRTPAATTSHKDGGLAPLARRHHAGPIDTWQPSQVPASRGLQLTVAEPLRHRCARPLPLARGLRPSQQGLLPRPQRDR